MVLAEKCLYNGTFYSGGFPHMGYERKWNWKVTSIGKNLV